MVIPLTVIYPKGLDNYYDLVVAAISMSNGMQATNSSPAAAADRLKYLPDDHTDAQNAIALAKLFAEVSSQSSYRDPFAARLDQFKALWNTEIVQEVLLEDAFISFFLMGDWASRDNVYYMDFEASGNKNLVYCSYNLPYPDADRDYYDIENRTLLFENSGSTD